MGGHLYPSQCDPVPDRLQPFFSYYHSAGSCKPARRRGVNSPSKEQRDLEEPEPQSSFMLLVSCNEAFGYTHDQTLDSSMVLILAMLREHGYIVNERNKTLYKDDESEDDDSGEWVEVTDFDTGQKKRVRKMKSI